MKKFFSFLMAVCATLTLSAQSSKHAPKAVLTDTIKVSCAYWEYSTESPSHYHHVLRDNAIEPTYEFEIDCMAFGTEAVTGTFIMIDPDSWDSPDDYIDDSDSKVVTYTDGMGDETYFEYGTKVVITENNGYDLYAVIVSEGSVYAVTAHKEAKPSPKKTVTLAYTTDAEFWSTKSLFGFTAKDKFAAVSDDSIETHIVLHGDPKTVVGEYEGADFADGNYLSYESATPRRVTVWDDIRATITDEDGYYLCSAEIFGSDTILYQISLKAAKPEVIVPKDTVEITATNLRTSFDESAGIADFEATNAAGDEISITLNTYDLYGSYTSYDLKMGSIKHNGSLHSLTMAFDIDLTVEQEESNFPHITGSVLGNDTVLYVLDLSHAVPAPKEEVNITFTTTGESCFFTRQGYYFMYNANDKYLMAMEVYTSLPEGTYTYYDFNRSYTHLGVISATDTTDVLMLNCTATVSEAENNRYTLEADFLGSDSVLYHISSSFNYSESEALEYDAVTGSVDRSYNASDNVVLRVEDSENQKVFFRAASRSQSDEVALYFYVEDTTTVLIPAGTYDIDDSGAAGTVYACQGVETDDMLYPSYYGTLNAAGHLSSVFMLRTGTVEVAYVEGKLTFTLEGKNSNNLPVKIVYDGTQTAIEQTTVRPAAVKFLRNGQLYIQQGDKTYTLMGALAE